MNFRLRSVPEVEQAGWPCELVVGPWVRVQVQVWVWVLAQVQKA